jgi:hypothetical protein
MFSSVFVPTGQYSHKIKSLLLQYAAPASSRFLNIGLPCLHRQLVPSLCGAISHKRAESLEVVRSEMVYSELYINDGVNLRLHDLNNSHLLQLRPACMGLSSLGRCPSICTDFVGSYWPYNPQTLEEILQVCLLEVKKEGKTQRIKLLDLSIFLYSLHIAFYKRPL